MTKKFRIYQVKPRRDQLWNMSASEFKTFLRKHGFKVPREFFKRGSVCTKKNRFYRFRYWAQPEFFVDISCPVNEFDRWANSVDQVINFYNFIENMSPSRK